MTDCATQSLTDYRWENRLVLILADSGDSPFLKDQLNALRDDDPGLRDRKLMVFQVTPTGYREGLDGGRWQSDASLYQTHHRAGEEIILIGLDGGVKLRQKQVLTREKLYATIDVMPMRRAEKNRE